MGNLLPFSFPVVLFPSYRRKWYFRWMETLLCPCWQIFFSLSLPLLRLRETERKKKKKVFAEFWRFLKAKQSEEAAASLFICCFLCKHIFFQDMRPHVSRVTALFLLCQIFLIITHVPLIRVLAWIIFAGDESIFTEKGSAKLSQYKAKQVSYCPSLALTSVAMHCAVKFYNYDRPQSSIVIRNEIDCYKETFQLRPQLQRHRLSYCIVISILVIMRFHCTFIS